MFRVRFLGFKGFADIMVEGLSVLRGLKIQVCGRKDFTLLGLGGFGLEGLGARQSVHSFR